MTIISSTDPAYFLRLVYKRLEDRKKTLEVQLQELEERIKKAIYYSTTLC